MSNILKQVSLTRALRKADKSVSIQFVTDVEQTPEELMEMDRMISSRGILYYSDRGELTQAEIDELDSVDIELEGKSKSQRLRFVMYIQLEQLLGRKPSTSEFKDFYSQQMEIEIQKRKDKLD